MCKTVGILAKGRGGCQSNILVNLANAVDMNLCLSTADSCTATSLKDPRWMLAWSNPNINEDVLIRKALITARFTTILQACLDFGLDRVREQWEVMVLDPASSNYHAKNLVADILSNIAKGFSHA